MKILWIERNAPNNKSEASLILYNHIVDYLLSEGNEVDCVFSRGKIDSNLRAKANNNRNFNIFSSPIDNNIFWKLSSFFRVLTFNDTVDRILHYDSRISKDLNGKYYNEI